jgi:hypothetical protein
MVPSDPRDRRTAWEEDMKLAIHIAALTVLVGTSTIASADPRIAELCGPGHVNEVASGVDVRPNPVGFYIVSLRQQISERDPRIIFSTGNTFHLCTRVAATPDMDAAKALLLMGERTVKFLFVPTYRPGAGSSS